MFEPDVVRPRLTRAVVVGAAIEFIDEHGLPGLSMRRLGQHLGVEAMSIYHHVAGREDLLDAVVEAIFREMQSDPDVMDTHAQGWEHFLGKLAHGVRRLTVAHPHCFPLVAARPPEAPWLRPPLRSLFWTEKFIDVLASEGFSDEAVAGAYRAYTSFLLGHLLLEVARHGPKVGSLNVVEEAAGAGGVELEDHPGVARLRAPLSAHQAAVEFEESLGPLLRTTALMRKREDGDLASSR